MGDYKLIVFSVLFLSYGLLSDQQTTSVASTTTTYGLLSDQQTNSVANTTTTEDPIYLTCVIAQAARNYTGAPTCTNGRRMVGCCLDRTACNYNTTGIDLTMYGPRGYKSPCQDTSVCCPLEYVIPIVVTNTEPKENDDSSSEEFDDEITDADV